MTNTEQDFATLRNQSVGGMPASSLIDKSIEAGLSPGEAALALISQGFGPGHQTEANWKAQYEGSAALQAEFLSLQAYVALRRHDQGHRR